jgi:2-oxoglutarate ferredoxin oxidoreductase subunit delta
MNASFVVSIAKDKCKGCQLCVFFCPSKNLVSSQDLNKKGIKYVKVKDVSVCNGCGLCYIVCPDCCIEICEK